MFSLSISISTLEFKSLDFIIPDATILSNSNKDNAILSTNVLSLYRRTVMNLVQIKKYDPHDITINKFLL